jgi:hypothetical protein
MQGPRKIRREHFTLSHFMKLHCLDWGSMVESPVTGGLGISWFLVHKNNHEMRGSWIPRTVFSVKPQNGSKKILKSTFWTFFLWNFDFFPIERAFQVYMLYECLVIFMSNKEILIFIRWWSLCSRFFFFFQNSKIYKWNRW